MNLNDAIHYRTHSPKELRAFVIMLSQLFCSLLLTSLWYPIQCFACSNSSASISTVFQLETIGTWFENLVIRPNGLILATRVDAPELWSIDPLTRTGSSILSIPGFSGFTGITELSDGVYVMAAGNFTTNGGPVEGTARLLQVDLRRSVPEFKYVAQLSDAGLINGVERWDDQSVLLADSTRGLILKVNAENGQYSTAISDPTMAIPINASTNIGINGIKRLDNFVYYTSSAQELFCRIPVDSSAAATGSAQVLASGFPQDDFSLRPDGTAYIATNSLNTIVRVAGNGQVCTTAGTVDSIALAADTSCQFGRTTRDSSILYVSTAGGLTNPVNGTEVQPATIMAVDMTEEMC